MWLVISLDSFPNHLKPEFQGKGAFNQTKSVNVFCGQHIYINGTVQFLLTQHIKDGAGRLKREFQDQDGFLNLGYKPPATDMFNLSLGILLDLHGSCSSIDPKIDVITFCLKHLKKEYSYLHILIHTLLSLWQMPCNLFFLGTVLFFLSSIGRQGNTSSNLFLYDAASPNPVL